MTSDAVARWRDPRRAGYAVLLAAVALPVMVFVVIGADADGVNLHGAGGPLIAFSAGVLSFLSPCVLPLVPIYITHLAGTSTDTVAGIASRRVTFSHAVAFILGLSLVFVTLGASAGFAGSTVLQHQRSLEQGSGLLLLALGALLVPAHTRRTTPVAVAMLIGLVAVFLVLVELARLQDSTIRLALLGGGLLVLWLRFAGLLQLNVFQRTVQLNPGTGRPVSYSRSAMIGGAFATGWTPCVGPILGGILTLAATSQDVLTGVYLLMAYSAGFSIPFLITGLAVADVSRGLKKVNRFMPAFEVASAVMMVGLGILLISGRLTALNEYFSFADFNQGL